MSPWVILPRGRGCGKIVRMATRPIRDVILPGETLIVRFAVDDNDVRIEFFDEDGFHVAALDPTEQRKLAKFLAAAEKGRK